MCTCERVGGRREADAGVAYHGLSQFKFKITGLKFVTVEKPNWPLTTWTLTGNLHIALGECIKWFGKTYERA